MGGVWKGCALRHWSCVEARGSVVVCDGFCFVEAAKCGERGGVWWKAMRGGKPRRKRYQIPYLRADDRTVTL